MQVVLLLNVFLSSLSFRIFHIQANKNITDCIKNVFSFKFFVAGTFFLSSFFSRILSTWPVNHRLQNYMCVTPIIELHDPLLSSYIDYGTVVKRVKFSEMNRSPWQPMIAQHDMKGIRLFLGAANSIIFSL